mgnify:CR=1 FL=1
MMLLVTLKVNFSKIRFVDAGFLSRDSFGRIGRETKFPPRLIQIVGQRPFNSFSTQSLQKVHSKLQIIVSSESGGRSLSQHSQLGLSSSMYSYFTS